MVLKECALPCRCGNGAMYFSTLQEEHTGKAIMFILTEDEHIYFRGLCDYCKREFEVFYPVMKLLFDCPKDKEEH